MKHEEINNYVTRPKIIYNPNATTADFQVGQTVSIRYEAGYTETGRVYRIEDHSIAVVFDGDDWNAFYAEYLVPQ